jgi:hypothetical protein
MYWNKKYFLHNKQEESVEDAADSRKTSLGTYTRRGGLESHYERGCRVGGHQIPSEKQKKSFIVFLSQNASKHSCFYTSLLQQQIVYFFL